MGGADLVVAVSADPQHGGRLGAGQELLDELEAGQVRPLQIIQEHHERVLWGGEHLQELANHPVEAVLGLTGWHFLERGLRAGHDLQLGDQIHERLALALPGLVQPLAPPCKLLLGARQELLHQSADGLGQGGVGDVALELIELATQEEAASLHHRLVQLVHHRGLADAGVAADEVEQLWALALADALEALEQRGDLGIAPVEPLRELEAAGRVVLAQGELLRRALARLLVVLLQVRP